MERESREKREKEILEGEKAILRPIKKSDFLKLNKWKKDKEITRLVGGDFLPISYEELNLLYKKKLKDRDITYFSITTKEKDLIGSTNIRDIDWEKKEGTFGITISDENYRRKGYGSDTTKLILDYAFKTLNLKKINISFFEFNKGAASLFPKLGFIEEGRIKGKVFEDEEYWDEIKMGLKKENWI